MPDAPIGDLMLPINLAPERRRSRLLCWAMIAAPFVLGFAAVAAEMIEAAARSAP